MRRDDEQGRVDTSDSPVFGRGLSFTDAIYGFAITLLVVNLDVPAAADWSSLSALIGSGLYGQLFGYTLSFVVIAIFWRVNFRLVRSMSGMTSPVLTAQIVAAFFVVLIPFTTQGMSDPATRDLGLPTALYALNIALASLAQTATYLIAQRQGLTSLPSTNDVSRRLVLASLVTPLVFLASIPIAVGVGSQAAELSWLLLVVLGPLTGRIAPRAAPRPRAAS